MRAADVDLLIGLLFVEKLNLLFGDPLNSTSKYSRSVQKLHSMEKEKGKFAQKFHPWRDTFLGWYLAYGSVDEEQYLCMDDSPPLVVVLIGV